MTNGDGNGRFKLAFEPKVSLGNLVTLVAMIVTVSLWAGDVRSQQQTMRAAQQMLTERIAANERSLELFRDDRERLTRVEADTKSMSTKIDRIEDKVDRLIERGAPP